MEARVITPMPISQARMAIGAQRRVILSRQTVRIPPATLTSETSPAFASMARLWAFTSRG